MRPNVKVLDKSKNSFIYFQLGLIATMVAVLFVLELNFKTETPKSIESARIDLPDDIIFTYNPKLKAPKTEPKREVVKPVVKPASKPKVVDQFVETKKEVDNALVKESEHEDSNKATSTDNSQNENPVDANEGGEGAKEKVFVVVEFLPRFPNCTNVSKENQKACFDEQLKKEIFKHLKYPKRDLDNQKEGTVFVQFIIDENGNFTSIQAAENNRATREMRLAVVAAVKKLPKIIPARQGDRDVKIIYTIPISFKINK